MGRNFSLSECSQRSVCRARSLEGRGRSNGKLHRVAGLGSRPQPFRDWAFCGARFPRVRRMIRVTRVGTTRLDLIVGPWALKVSRGERGRRCNKYEANLFRTVDARRRVNALLGSLVLGRRCAADHVIEEGAPPAVSAAAHSHPLTVACCGCSLGRLALNASEGPTTDITSHVQWIGRYSERATNNLLRN
jgi:hypothetical protein